MGISLTKLACLSPELRTENSGLQMISTSTKRRDENKSFNAHRGSSTDPGIVTGFVGMTQHQFLTLTWWHWHENKTAWMLTTVLNMTKIEIEIHFTSCLWQRSTETDNIKSKSEFQVPVHKNALKFARCQIFTTSTTMSHISLRYSLLLYTAHHHFQTVNRRSQVHGSYVTTQK